MKLNADAAADLIEKEYQLSAMDLRSNIAEQNNIIEQSTNLTEENRNAVVSAAQDKISAYQQELAQLQANYDAQQDALSGYQAWQRALSSENPGKRYEDIQGALKNVKELYDNGETGTDDFRSYVSMLDSYGRDSVKAY